MRISVIIPALNEASHIERTLISVANQEGPMEIIVVDGGSSDETITKAQPHATVLSSPPGRARQMNHGAHAAAGDILFFLHADSQVPSNAFVVIREAITNPACLGGAFRLKFDRDTPLLRFYSFCTRFALPKICFGDRGLFIRRGAFEALGGFPEIQIFEDLEMVRLMHKKGGFCFLPYAVTTAARRFEEVGPLRQQLLNMYLWTRYQLGTAPKRLAHLYTYHRKKQ